MEDIRTAIKNNCLIVTSKQAVAILHAEDFQKVMERDEMTMIGDLIRDQLINVNSDFQLDIVGSYRRGKQSSKDVDVIIYTQKDLSSQY